MHILLIECISVNNTLNELAELTNCLKVYILLSLVHGAAEHTVGTKIRSSISKYRHTIVQHNVKL